MVPSTMAMDEPHDIDQARLAWLLEGDDPSVRYFTLTDLLGSPLDAAGVAAARHDIMARGAVPAILAAQDADGHWAGRDRFYAAKYTGTVWTLLILAELGADGSDERLRRGCEAVLQDSQDRLSGGFAVDRNRREGGGLHSRVIPCLTGNLVFSLVRLGLLDDKRVQAAIDWLTTWARFDDGDGSTPGTVAGLDSALGIDGDREPPSGWPYVPFEMCWGRHTCHMGVVKIMKGLAEIPPERRSPAVQRTLDDAAEFMLRHHIHKRSRDLSQVSKPGWRRLSFPLMYQTDVLEILLLLDKLGKGGDPRADEARAHVASRANADGRWILQQSFNGRFWVDIDTKGEPSRWVTLRALTALRRRDYSTDDAPGWKSRKSIVSPGRTIRKRSSQGPVRRASTSDGVPGTSL